MFIRWTHRNIQKEHLQNQHRGQTPCLRCGFDIYSFRHQRKCPATNAKCFKCNRVGHFQRRCYKKNDKRTKNKRNRKRSAKKRERDRKRMCEYNQRKSTCDVFPFSQVNNDELSVSLPKLSSDFIQKLQKENARLKALNDNVDKIKDDHASAHHDFACEINILTNKVKDLQLQSSEIENLQREYLLLTSQNARLDQDASDLRSKLQDNLLEIQNLKFEASQFQARTASLEQCNHDLMLSVRDKTAQIEDLECQLDDLDDSYHEMPMFNQQATGPQYCNEQAPGPRYNQPSSGPMFQNNGPRYSQPAPMPRYQQPFSNPRQQFGRY